MKLWQIMNSYVAKLTSERELPMNFIRFYVVGLVLFMLPFTRGLFVSITALSLLLVIGVILYNHREWNLKTILLFAFIVVSSFLLEMQGTATGKIFGAYYYDRGLGLKINNTPLIIGINWLFLVYASHDVANRISNYPSIRILIGSSLMILYDILLEWVAPFMQMWRFDSGYPPLQNFVAWFIAAFVFHSGFELLRIRTDNKPARMLFFIQAGFFVFIGTYGSLFLQ